MCDKTAKEPDESVLSADSSNSVFFIDDYSHLRLSYYQYRDDISLDVSDSASYQDSAYSTNASTSKDESGIKDFDNTNSTHATNASNSKVLNEEERHKLREYYVSQIPDLPHPSYTVAKIISSASHKMDPANRFVYNNRIEQGTRTDEDLNVETFAPQRRSTMNPDKKKLNK